MARLYNDKLFESIVRKAKKCWEKIREQDAYVKAHAFQNDVYKRAKSFGVRVDWLDKDHPGLLDKLLEHVRRWEISPLQDPNMELEDFSLEDGVYKKWHKRFVVDPLILEKVGSNEFIYWAKVHPIFTAPFFKPALMIGEAKDNLSGRSRKLPENYSESVLFLNRNCSHAEQIAWLAYWLKNAKKKNYQRAFRAAQIVEGLKSAQAKDDHAQKISPFFFGKAANSIPKLSLDQLLVFSARRSGYSFREIEKQIPEMIKNLPRSRKTLSSLYHRAKRLINKPLQ